MRSKSILLLTLALGCGLVASIGISQIMDSRKGGPTHTGNTAPVFIALMEIESRTPITPQMVKLEEYDISKIPPGAISKLDEIADKRARTKIYQGEPILAAKLVGVNEADRATGMIPKGYRAVPVSVDAVSGGSGLILPGDRVDVLVCLARNPGTGIEEASVKTILQGVKVFSVDTTTEGKGEHPETSIAAKTISLLVTLKQAEKITLGSTLGSIRLVMRSVDDEQQADSGGATLDDLFGTADKSDRVADEGRQPKDDKSFAKWLTGQKSQLVEKPAADGTGNWKIVLMEGNEVRHVEISEDGTVTDDASGDTQPDAPKTNSDSDSAPVVKPSAETARRDAKAELVLPVRRRATSAK